DHADHSADQSEQRPRGDGESKEALEALQLWNLVQDRLRESQLDELGIARARSPRAWPVRSRRQQHAAERVVRSRLVEPLKLGTYLDAGANQIRVLEHGGEEPDRADGD